MTGLDPDLPVRELEPADRTIERANTQGAILRDMLNAFALLGLGLASLGIYGVIARTMAQRTGEFAIRFALGASVRDITRIVLTSGVKLALIGSALGLLGAVGLSRLLAVAFPGMHLNNTLISIGATLLLIAIALVASWLPRAAPRASIRSRRSAPSNHETRRLIKWTTKTGRPDGRVPDRFDEDGLVGYWVHPTTADAASPPGVDRMKAIRYCEYGPPDDVLKIEPVEKPVPNDNQILVRVRAVSLKIFRRRHAGRRHPRPAPLRTSQAEKYLPGI